VVSAQEDKEPFAHDYFYLTFDEAMNLRDALDRALNVIGIHNRSKMLRERGPQRENEGGPR